MDTGEKHYHFTLGFPEGFDITRYTRHVPDKLVGSEHYQERMKEKGLPRSIPKDWVLKAKLITITQSRGGSLHRYALRGPALLEYKRDFTVVIDAPTWLMVTGWFNNTHDWHRLTTSEYSTPEEGTK